MSAFMAVFWSIVLAVVLSLLDPRNRLAPLWAAGAALAAGALALAFGARAPEAAFWALAIAMALPLFALAPPLQALAHVRLGPMAAGPEGARLAHALAAGAKDAVAIAVTCATAGIIVSVITLTGLGLKISGLIADWGQGSLILTILFAAVAMWVLGAAVPVTASYIIGAVTLAPALTQAGAPEAAAHMFLFYYAVLGDVSPPTALAPFAASAITGGNPFHTMGQAWKYCLPAFVAPVMFCVSPEGAGLLLQADPFSNALAVGSGLLGVVAAAAGLGGWIIRAAQPWERAAMIAAGLALLYPSLWSDIAGLSLAALAVAAHGLTVRPGKEAP
jgi:TRAP-type uncharacterized transport system fused permease subunit